MSEMWSRYRVGEQMGPYVVESVELTDCGGGEWLEKVVNSGRTVMQVLHRPIESPKLFVLPPQNGKTRTVIPYVPQYKHSDARHPLTVAAAPMDAHWVNVEGSPHNYWSLMKNAWDSKHNLFLIEHDVEARPEGAAEFERCGCDWGFSQYHHFSEVDREAWHWGILGYTFFSSRLIAKYPRLIADLDMRWRDWHEMSTGIGMALRELGLKPHEHQPPVFHHRMDPERGA